MGFPVLCYYRGVYSLTFLDCSGISVLFDYREVYNLSSLLWDFPCCILFKLSVWIWLRYGFRFWQEFWTYVDHTQLLLNRPLCPSDDPIGHGTEVNWTELWRCFFILRWTCAVDRTKQLILQFHHGNSLHCLALTESSIMHSPHLSNLYILLTRH